MAANGELVKQKEIIARKDHEETMSEWFRHNDLSDLEPLTFSEWRSIARLKANNWMIKKGQKCMFYVAIDCHGKIYNAYYLKEIYDIVKKYDLADFYC